MQVRLLKSVKNTSGWHTPGKILDLVKEEADDLIKRKAAVLISPTPAIQTKKQVIDIEAVVEELILIEGVKTELAEKLAEAGFTSIESIATASIQDLTKVKGIGEKFGKKLQESSSGIFATRKLISDMSKVEGVDEGLAEALIEDGVESVEALAVVDISVLTAFEGITDEIAQKIIDSAKKLADETSTEGA